MRLTVRVPATVANLGPGFDCFGLALAIHNELTIDTDAEPGVTVFGEGEGELPLDESNLIIRAMRAFTDAAGRSLPPFALHCLNEIPLERGLGSSAAAVVGGLLLANEFFEPRLAWNDLLGFAVQLEGHADNAGAALRGGATIAYLDDDRWHVEQLEPHQGLRPVVLIPETERVSTEAARAALPNEVPRDDATFNAARAALVTIALTTRPDLLAVALEDRLHQQRRLALAPGAKTIFDELSEANVPVCVAGSGPTLLAFETDVAVPEPAVGWRVLRPDIEREATKVLEST